MWYHSWGQVTPEMSAQGQVYVVALLKDIHDVQQLQV